MTNSSAGDQMAISVDRRGSDESMRIKATGFFEIKKTCAKTGKVTEYGGPNAIMKKGLSAMLRGFTASAGTAGAKLLLRFSGASVNPVPGNIIATTPAALGNLTAGSLTQTGSITGTFGADPSSNLSAGAALSIFDSKTADENTSGKSFTVAHAIQVTSGTAGNVVNTIAILDDGTADEVFAIRSSGGGTGTADHMAAVTLDSGDSLTVTYTIEITATAT